MEIVDKECENVIQKALNYEKSNRYSNEYKLVETVFTEETCSSQIINKLKDCGYINLKEEKFFNGKNIFHFTLTRDGENYFISKKQQIKSNKKMQLKEQIHFWVLLIIETSVKSIISICQKII